MKKKITIGLVAAIAVVLMSVTAVVHCVLAGRKFGNVSDEQVWA